MLVLCVVKLVATVFSYSSGGAGGIFAPSLFIGGMLGGAFGALDAALFHARPTSWAPSRSSAWAPSSPASSARRSRSVLIIVEMTGGYCLILPLMIANMTAYGLARHCRPMPIYEALLEQDGIHLHQRGVVSALAGLRVADVPLDTRPYATFEPGTPRAGLLAGLSSPERQEVFPVIAEGEVVGIVTLADLVSLSTNSRLGAPVNASELMRAAPTVRLDEDLRVAFESMLANGVRELPVTDETGRLLGFVDEISIAHACARASARSPA